MKKLLIVFTFLLVAIIVASNIVVLTISNGRCYDDVNIVPHANYCLLLGTGRSHDPSPYYDARVQAAIELYQAGKVDLIYISGENDIRDYHEVDQMAKDIHSIIPDAPIMLDYNGTNTWQSLNNLGNTLGYHSSVTIASQKFHNQRAVFLGSVLFRKTPIAYNATDTKDFWWSLFSFVRESLARTKEVLMLPIRISN